VDADRGRVDHRAVGVMAGHSRAYQQLEPDDLTLDLLAALAGLSPLQRELWIDRYVCGEPIALMHRQHVSAAKKRLRAALAGAL
jgi:DNA-directed RNA polymerase specialized sigma24 family protein